MAKYLAEHERKMQLTKEEFKNRLKRKLNDYYEEDIDTASTSELFAAISAIVRDGYAPQWRRTRIAETKQKKNKFIISQLNFCQVLY